MKSGGSESGGRSAGDLQINAGLGAVGLGGWFVAGAVVGSASLADRYRPGAPIGQVATKQPCNSIGTFECLQGLIAHLVLDAK